MFQSDKFVLETGYLGDIEKVIIGHDGDGVGSGWFLNKVVVKPKDKSKSDDDADDDDDDVNERKFVFPCERWLDVGEDDAAIERELLRQEEEDNQTPPDDPWKVHVTTSDDANASVDERIAIVIYGANGKSRRLYLGEKGQLKGQGQTDSYDVMVRPDLGQVYKVRVGFGNLKEKTITWKMDKVCVFYMCLQTS